MPYRNLIIIGSGPAGLTAGLYAARANLKPLLIEGFEAGGQLMLTTLVENWPGFRDGIMGPDLIADIRAQAERFGAEIVRGQVTSVDLGTRPFSVTVGETKYSCRSLIIATGASARLLGLPSERALLGHGVSTCATCDGYFFRGKPIAVVGGGDSALEEAIFLTRFASHVTVVHRRDTLRASKIMQDKAFANPKISFEWNSDVEEILATGPEVTGIRLTNNRTGERKDIAGRRRVRSHRSYPEHVARQRPDRARLERLHRDAPGLVHHRAGRVRVRRRAGSRLPPGDYGRRIGLHGGDRCRALHRRSPTASRGRSAGEVRLSFAGGGSAGIRRAFERVKFHRARRAPSAGAESFLPQRKQREQRGTGSSTRLHGWCRAGRVLASAGTSDRVTSPVTKVGGTAGRASAATPARSVTASVSSACSVVRKTSGQLELSIHPPPTTTSPS